VAGELHDQCAQAQFQKDVQRQQIAERVEAALFAERQVVADEVQVQRRGDETPAAAHQRVAHRPVDAGEPQAPTAPADPGGGP